MIGQVDRHAVGSVELDLDIATLGHFIGSRISNKPGFAPLLVSQRVDRI